MFGAMLSVVRDFPGFCNGAELERRFGKSFNKFYELSGPAILSCEIFKFALPRGTLFSSRVSFISRIAVQDILAHLRLLLLPSAVNVRFTSSYN
jgi:hypothetical protein